MSSMSNCYLISYISEEKDKKSSVLMTKFVIVIDDFIFDSVVKRI